MAVDSAVARIARSPANGDRCRVGAAPVPVFVPEDGGLRSGPDLAAATIDLGGPDSCRCDVGGCYCRAGLAVVTPGMDFDV